MLKSIILEVWEIRIKIVADIDDLINSICTITHIASIPVQIKTDNNSNYDLTLKFFCDSSPSILKVNAFEFNININWSNTGNKVICIANIIGQFLNYICYTKNINLIHSAAVQLNGKTILLVGDSGKGKTNLCFLLSNYGKWIADDWIGIQKVCNSICIVNAFDSISFRMAGLNEFDFISDKAIRKKIKLISNKAITKKVFLSYNDLGFSIAPLPVEINLIAFINIGKYKINHTESLTFTNSCKRLFKEFSWVLRGEGSKIYDINGSLAFNGFNLLNMHDIIHIEKNIKEIVKKCEFISISGSLKFAKDFLLAYSLDS